MLAHPTDPSQQPLPILARLPTRPPSISVMREPYAGLLGWIDAAWGVSRSVERFPATHLALWGRLYPVGLLDPRRPSPHPPIPHSHVQPRRARWLDDRTHDGIQRAGAQGKPERGAEASEKRERGLLLSCCRPRICSPNPRPTSFLFAAGQGPGPHVCRYIPPTPCPTRGFFSPQVKDLGLVIAVGGAVLGSTIVYILPALMFLFNMRRKAKAGAIFTKGQKLEVLANKALLVMGTALGVLGVYTSLK